MTHAPSLNAFDITARARAAYGPDGRLALPKVAHWPICPFETDSLEVRHLDDPVVPEPPRGGEDAHECHSCQAPDDEFLWTDSRWRVSMSEDPMALPNVWLQCPGRVDPAGSQQHRRRPPRPPEPLGRRRRPPARTSHGRPNGMVQLRGIFLMTWIYALPPLPSDAWNAMREHVAASLRSK